MRLDSRVTASFAKSKDRGARRESSIKLDRLFESLDRLFESASAMRHLEGTGRRNWPNIGGDRSALSSHLASWAERAGLSQRVGFWSGRWSRGLLRARAL